MQSGMENILMTAAQNINCTSDLWVEKALNTSVPVEYVTDRVMHDGHIKLYKQLKKMDSCIEI